MCHKKILFAIGLVALVIGFVTGCAYRPPSLTPIQVIDLPVTDDYYNYPYDNYNAMHRHYYDDNA